MKCLGSKKYLKLQEHRHAMTTDSGSSGKPCQLVALARHGVCPEWSPSLICPTAQWSLHTASQISGLGCAITPLWLERHSIPV